jgi:bifunctional DNA-binding transcriptional regulator/antitoxin component of YhaV-PrlF toxin-antitoxin module
MQEKNLSFLLQQTITSEGKITVPHEVRKLLFSDPESTENLYIWNYDKKDNYIIISKDSLRETQSSLLLTSPVEENNPRRTTIPAKVRKKFNLEEGDELYFVTPEAVKSGTPAVFVWTFEQIEEIILGGADEGGSGFPRKPHF